MQELDLYVYDPFVVLAACIDAVMTAAADEQLCVGSTLGNAQGRSDRSDGVVLGDHEQDRASNTRRLSDRPVGNRTEDRASGDAVMPLRAVLGTDDL
jgi:hypothetical protein